MSSSEHQSSPIVNPKQRVFGIAENALIKTSLQHQGYMKVGEVLQLQGPHISLGMLESAVACLQRRHPFLRSRLQINPAKPDSYLMEEDNTLRFNIQEIARKREEHLNFWCQEWREREKQPAVIGQGLAEFWLLQDPEDVDSENGPREMVIICDHSICDGLSLSIVAHELLLALADNDNSIFGNSLEWPKTIEAATDGSLSKWSAFVGFCKVMFAVLYWRATSGRFIARIPLPSIQFPPNDMAKHCHTEASYGSLNKEETKKLVEKCHREGVTVTSAISSAILSVAATLVSDQRTQLTLAVAADSRRRCIPPIPNHDLSYQVSGVMAFSISSQDTPTTSNGMWQLAKKFGHYVITSIDAGQILIIGKFIGKLYEKNLESVNLAAAPTCGISNWGLLPFDEQYGKWKLVGMTPLSNMIRLPMPMALAQTVNGVLTISFFGAVPFIYSNTLENLRNGTMHNLQQMIED